MERIINILKEAQVSDFRIMEVKKISHQAFFVRQFLDQHRISETVHTTLDVYMDTEENGQKFRGRASKEIYQNESDEEIRKDIEQLKFNASLAKNPFYEIVKDEQYHEEEKEYDLTALLNEVVQGVQNVRDTDSEKINSYEVFVNGFYYHIVNSQGTDVAFNTMNEEVEIVINSVDNGHEIEIYHDSTFAGKPVSEITDDILDIFKIAKDRTKASPTKKMNNARVLLSGDFTSNFYVYFLYKVNTSDVFFGESQTKLGDDCQEGSQGDKITLKLVSELPQSSKNMPYSKDGNKALDLMIVENGIYQNYWGDQITGYYLGVEKITEANNFVVEPGSKSVAEMKQEPYLEIVKFSDFGMDTITGNFGGEIRLGYYYDGEKVIPVTGGSITCNMEKALKHIYLSRETKQYDNCIVPCTIELFDVNVAGEQ